MSEVVAREHKLGCDEYHRHYAPKCCDNACWCLRGASSAPCPRHCWQVWDQHRNDARCCQCDTPRGPLDMQNIVREWHSKFGVVIGEAPAIRRPELHASLIEEGARETCDAIRAGDLAEAIDGTTREDGKVMKPEGRKPPRIAEMLAARRVSSGDS